MSKAIAMTRELIGASLIALVALVGMFIYRSVVNRRRQQEEFLPAPDSAEIRVPLFECFYVATVFADRPLERVWANGLGGRGRARVGLSDLGLVIERTGERSIQISFDAVQNLTRGGATIDRGVEMNGLVQIQWTLGQTTLVTSLRITSNQEANYRKLREAVGV